MKNLSVKSSLLCALMAIFFVACEKDTFLNKPIEQLQTTAAKKAVAKMVESQRASSNPGPIIQLFQNSRTANDAAIQQTVSESTLTDLQQTVLENLRTEAPAMIELKIPTIKSKDFELELVKVDIFTSDFEVTNELGHLVNGDLGIHYQGIIKGDNNSLAAISIYEDQVMGFFSNREGNYTIGKMETEQANPPHIIYLDSDLNRTPDDLVCGTPDDNVTYSNDVLNGVYEDARNRAVGTVRTFIEVSDDIYNEKGLGTTSFVTGLFNQSAVIYANEDITTQISDLLIWTSTSPYNGTDTYEELAIFKNQYSNSNPFDGDLAHLLTFTNYGGRAAGFDGLCNPNIDNSMCVSGIANFYNSVPTYSFSVYIFAHEMGHLMGSRHTHACVWNGNNTAIDGCSGSTEGSCNLPPNPSNGGTIMSYCNGFGDPGINFNLGFGPQPGNVIRADVAACDDGSDCGGGGGSTVSGCGITVNISGLDVTLAAKTLMGSGIIKVRTPSWSWAETMCNDWTGDNCIAGQTVTVPGPGTYEVDVQYGGVCTFSITVDGSSAGGIDNDGDGICSDVDCDDNNPNIGEQQAPGTACNDGDSNTINDVIQADGCLCAGEPIGGVDNDGDGIDSDVDCDDNDPNIGEQQTPGTACNDGNSNTINDVIQADGCLCAGDPIGGNTASGCGIVVGLSGLTVTLNSNSNNDYEIIKVRTATWTWSEILCNDWTGPLCTGGQSVTVPSSGTYVIDVQGAGNCTFTVNL